MKKIYTLFYIINNIEKEESKPEDPDKIFSEDFEEFAEITEALNQAKFEPRQSTIDNIMNFSRSYEVVESKFLKKISLIKN